MVPPFFQEFEDITTPLFLFSDRIFQSVCLRIMEGQSGFLKCMLYMYLQLLQDIILKIVLIIFDLIQGFVHNLLTNEQKAYY